MSTIADVSKTLETSSNEGQHLSLLFGAVRMLTSREGGLVALRQTFERNGLGHIISSWIGTGENAPISADQIKATLGDERVADLAKKAMISSDTATRYLSNSLPRLVDALTPNGKVGEAGELLSIGREILAALTRTRKPCSTFTAIGNASLHNERLSKGVEDGSF